MLRGLPSLWRWREFAVTEQAATDGKVHVRFLKPEIPERLLREWMKQRERVLIRLRETMKEIEEDPEEATGEERILLRVIRRLIAPLESGAILFLGFYPEDIDAVEIPPDDIEFPG